MIAGNPRTDYLNWDIVHGLIYDLIIIYYILEGTSHKTATCQTFLRFLTRSVLFTESSIPPLLEMIHDQSRVCQSMTFLIKVKTKKCLDRGSTYTNNDSQSVVISSVSELLANEMLRTNGQSVLLLLKKS